MSNETCVVTIADIYGADWWERNKEELEREWEWEFGVAKRTDLVANATSMKVEAYNWGNTIIGTISPRIILHRRKPKPPTLREVYGKDEVTIPVGWEWTREWREPMDHEWRLGRGGSVCINVDLTGPRLILRKRQPKVWFKAEEQERLSNKGDWTYLGEESGWYHNVNGVVIGRVLCATRHEEIDQTVQVVTQAMVDEVVKNA